MNRINYTIIIGSFIFISCNTNEKKKNESALNQLSNPANKATCVSFCSDENNEPVISWCETDTAGRNYFLFSYFDKENNHYKTPINIPIEQNVNLHAEGMPKLAFKNDGTILAIYECSAPTEKNKFAGFVRYTQSFNKGKSWTKPQYLHAETMAGKSHSFASLTRLMNGEIGACWLGATLPSKNGRPLMFSKTNGANGFTNELMIDSVACPCCRTAISSDNKGNISIMFRDIIQDSIRDMAIISSIDNGENFAKAVAFTNDGWVIDGCPHNGPSVINQGGNSFASWYTGGNKAGVYYASINSKGKVVERKKISSKARNIQLCLLPGNKKLVAYNVPVKEADSFYSKIAIGKIENEKLWWKDISSQKSQASLPVLHKLGNDAVIVAWLDNNRVNYTVINESEINNATIHEDETSGAEEPILQAENNPLKTDPVCGMKVKSMGAEMAFFNGNKTWFCSATCKEQFEKNPEKFR